MCVFNGFVVVLLVLFFLFISFYSFYFYYIYYIEILILLQILSLGVIGERQYEDSLKKKPTLSLVPFFQQHL